MGYVGTMEAFGGDEMFALSYLQATVKHILAAFNHSYEEIGKIRPTVWQSEWNNPGFAEWLCKTYPKNCTGNFTAVEMRGLYGVLGDSSVLFGGTLINKTLQNDCKWDKNPAQSACGFLAQMDAVFKLAATDRNSSNVTTLIEHSLCPNSTNQTNQCFSQLDLLEFIDFYIQHLNSFTIQLFIGSTYDIVTSMPQKNFALGYTMKNVIDPRTNRDVQIPGIVMVHATEADARTAEKESTFYTCEAEDSKKQQWAGKASDSFGIRRKSMTSLPGPDLLENEL